MLRLPVAIQSWLGFSTLRTKRKTNNPQVVCSMGALRLTCGFGCNISSMHSTPTCCVSYVQHPGAASSLNVVFGDCWANCQQKLFVRMDGGTVGMNMVGDKKAFGRPPLRFHLQTVSVVLGRGTNCNEPHIWGTHVHEPLWCKRSGL